MTRTVQRRSIAMCASAVLLSLLAAQSDARGDGGIIRYSGRHRNWILTVFTASNPVCTSALDISVMVQDADSGRPRTDLPIAVRAELDNVSAARGMTVRTEATVHQATNKLLRASELNLSQPGRWEIEVSITGLEEPSPIHFKVDVAEGSPPWTTMGIWIGWPFAAIALFAIHQWMVYRNGRSSVARTCLVK